MVVFILDMDPIKAAQSLTIQLATNYIKRLKFSFALAHVHHAKKPPHFSRVIPEVTYSKQNYAWYSEFYRALCEMINPENIKVDIFRDEYVFMCKEIKFKGEKLLFDINQTNISNEEIINKNRIAFIEKRYTHNKFVHGYPSWYLKIDGNIYKKYNRTLKRDFRIEYRDGRYRYYIADYFNQWEEIQDVPLEIDGFIQTILKNN